MAKYVDLTGNKYGKLFVIKKSEHRVGKQKRVAWDCLCDCGNRRTIATSDLKSGHRKSCGCGNSSIKTNEKYGSLVAVRATDERKNGGVVWETLCDCGNTHFVDAGNLSRGNIKSCGCSTSDRAKVRGKRFGRLVALKIADTEKKDRIYWICKCDCGNKTTVSANSLSSGRTKSCGCYAIDLVSGENSRFYNKELSDQDRLKNNRYVSSKENVRLWRKQVYEKNDYTCQTCGVVGGDLNAHHLNGWHWFEEGRFDIENGVTLCVGCHKQFHFKYGNKNNTKKQFIDYKTNIEKSS